jgi:mitochondrial fission protein ELM1
MAASSAVWEKQMRGVGQKGANMREPSDLDGPARLSIDEIAPVWVLDDPRGSTSTQVIGIAERLGVPHLRVPLMWNWKANLGGFMPGGSLLGLATGGTPPWPLSAPRGPALALSAGVRSRGVALWLRSTFGTRIVLCGGPGWHSGLFDMLVVPRGLGRVRPRSNVLQVLGTPHRLSPLVLSQARLSWAARLAHLPRPLIAVLAGGGAAGGPMRPLAAHALARNVAQLAITSGGSVMATTSRRTGADATEALAAGLAPSMHLLYRWGEPGDNPYAGFIGLADAIVVSGDSTSMISEACAAEAPVFIADLGGGPHHRALHASLYRAGQARPLGDSLSAWPRTPLDEAGRVATEIRARMAIGPQAVD